MENTKSIYEKGIKVIVYNKRKKIGGDRDEEK